MGCSEPGSTRITRNGTRRPDITSQSDAMALAWKAKKPFKVTNWGVQSQDQHESTRNGEI